jgi:prepilin-type N-terminal cleavage/methylation domain-containing protein
MAKKAVKAMTPTCTALMRSEKRWKAEDGFTLIEAMVAMAIVAMLTTIAIFNLTEPIRRSTFRAQADSFVSTMQQAARAAHETGRRYEVIIDIVEQQYILRKISSDNLADVLEEEIINIEDFGENCMVSYVEFDDPDEEIAAVDTDTETLQAKFRAGPAGWQYGGKIVLTDRTGRYYSVIVSTLSRVVTLKEGDVEILKSKRPDELPF